MRAVRDEAGPTGHWAAVAGAWGHVGPPLRPSTEDLAVVREVARATAGPVRSLRVVVLGVTVELAELAWPAGTQVLGVDHTPAMVASVWPGPPGTAVLGDWTALPIASGSIDLVAGDGGFHLVDPDGQRRLAAELGRILRAGAHAVLRLFVPPGEPESRAAVLDDLRAGRVRDLNELKLRLWMAMRADPGPDVRLHEVWQAVADVAGSEPDVFAASIGWDPEHLGALGSYRGSGERYHLVDLAAATS
jgi:SAM-dependent methyltransferase